jgi:hypothetical protein
VDDFAQPVHALRWVICVVVHDWGLETRFVADVEVPSFEEVIETLDEGIVAAHELD